MLATLLSVLLWNRLYVFLLPVMCLNPRSATVFLHSCSDNCSATFLKIVGPGHPRSGHQVRSSDPASEKKLSNRVTAAVEEKDLKLSGFVYYQAGL